jgi:8-oxo-dGTP pyrophosphatase MutT (NUDIX family)
VSDTDGPPPDTDGPPPDTGGPPSGTPRPGLRPRYVQRVDAGHLGARVSVRHLVDDPERGPVPSDVVGRLLAFDDEMALIVDRGGRLHVLDTTRILASRVIPAHPRLAPEPDVGTEEHPLQRDAARILLLDADHQVLLVAHAADRQRQVWTAPGGGLEPGEDHHEAARRELVEELGLHLPIGPWVWSRRARFTFRGVWIDQRERWYLARTDDDFRADDAPLDDIGAVVARWWSLPALRSTSADLAPGALADHLEVLLRDGPPATPIEVGR